MRNSILSGFFIGIASFVYLNVGGVIGALGFSLGLVLVCMFSANLFTVKAGEVDLKNELGKLFGVILVGNFIGCIITAGICSIPVISDVVGESLRKTLETRYSTTVLEAISKAVMCGVIIDCIVYAYKKTKNVVPVLLGVPVFILCGFYHSIADCFYYALGFFYDIKTYYAMAASPFIGAPDYIPGLQYLENYMIKAGDNWYNAPILVWISSIIGNFIGCNMRRVLYKEVE